MLCKQLTQQILRPCANGSLSGLSVLRRLLNASAVDGKLVVVQQDNGEQALKFPAVWLRDNCQCPECFHEHTKSRIVNWERSNAEVLVGHIAADASNDAVSIEWNDKHKSTFALKWLAERDFGGRNRQRYIEEIYKPAPVLWAKEEFPKVLRTFAFADVMQKDNVLLAWLEALAIGGFAMIKNAPADTTVARQLAERIGFIKRTTYGEEFEVKSKENARNYAYLMTPLPLHTDMPYYEYKAGINILHCLIQSQSQGGANLLTDGFNIAEKLRKEYPEYFKILLKTPVDWYDIGKDSDMAFHSIWRAPVICLDIDGQYARINHNITKRDSHFTVPLEQVAPWYEAYDKFLQLAYTEAVEFKTQPGDVFVFNNLRMLHGRTAYEDAPGNKRHLIGAYVDWDIIYSRLRILRSQQ